MKKFKGQADYDANQEKIFRKLNKALENGILHGRFTRLEFSARMADLLARIDPNLTCKPAWKIEQCSIDYTVTCLLEYTSLFMGEEYHDTFYGYIDVYYLKHRRGCTEPDKIYITEFGLDKG